MPKHPAEEYIDGVLAGRITVCRFVRLAVERHVRDLETGRARGLIFDERAALHAIEFNRFLRHSKGEWAGQEFVLAPWQAFSRWCVYGWRKEDGTRRFREAYFEVARKNGKTTDGSANGLYLFAGDGEPGAEVYCAATKRDQARIMHSEAVRMVKKSPALRRRIKWHRDNLHYADGASKFEPLGADADTCDGLNASGLLLDELHAHKTRDMVDVLETATGARRQPMTLYYTTAGYNRNSVCWTTRERVRKMLTGVAPDDSLFGIIYTLDQKYDWPDLLTEKEAQKLEGQREDAWEDPRNWLKANPNLGVSVKLDDIERQCRKAQNDPASLNAFLRYKINVWTSQSVRWMPMDRWDASAGAVSLPELAGRECWAGLDLSSRNDLCALVLVFPFGDVYKVLPFFWIPEARMRERIKTDRVPYDVWERQGFVTVTPGNVVDYDQVIDKIIECRDTYLLREIGFDTWGMDRIVQEMDKHGFVSGEEDEDGCRIVPFRQGTFSMSTPMKEMMNLVLEGKLHHGGHPVLRWNADGVVADTDQRLNIAPNKAKSAARIDGIVATIMALGRASLGGGETAPPEAYRVSAGGSS